MDNRKDWHESIIKNFPDREWFHLEWNSNRFPFDKKFITNMPEIKEFEVKEKKSKWLKYLKNGILHYPQ
ncbi:hypothetical protein [Flavobacterium sp. FlaQc-28]|uniref:hypothetical protein n=1 Tax=Flavobacterium sp. FlaQc-28 TaxID=3374178 RepID=UPI00375805D5